MPVEKIYSYNGHSLTLEGWSKKLGIARGTLYRRRHKHGDDLAAVLCPELQLAGKKARLIQIGDESKTVREWAEQCGKHLDTIYNRIRKGLVGQVVISRGRRTGYGVKVSHNGFALTQTEWAKKLGLSRERIRQRLKKYPVNEALSKVNHCIGCRPKLFFTVGGETLSINEWSKRSGLSYVTIYQRLKRGIPPEIACTVKGRVTAKVT